MLEGQLAFYLNKYLGQYVSGLDPESLRVSVWKGDIELRNLQLRPEALDAFNLPITVKAGILGTLRLKVRAVRAVAYGITKRVNLSGCRLQSFNRAKIKIDV